MGARVENRELFPYPRTNCWCSLYESADWNLNGLVVASLVKCCSPYGSVDWNPLYCFMISEFRESLYLYGGVDWNLVFSMLPTAAIGRSHTRARIWTMNIDYKALDAPYTGSVDWNSKRTFGTWINGRRSPCGSVDWNGIAQNRTSPSRSPRGSVDWNSTKVMGSPTFTLVAPLAGAWIET